MATLNEVFTNIANAIRSKKGTTDKMTPTNMPSEIESIESGSGTGGLVGYSSSVFNLSSYVVAGILADGTYTKTFSSSDKYIHLILAGTNTNIYGKTNCEVVGLIGFASSTYVVYLATPNGDDFECGASHAGGSGN